MSCSRKPSSCQRPLDNVTTNRYKKPMAGKDAFIQFRASESDKAMFEKVAANRGLSLSALITTLLYEEKDRQKAAGKTGLK